MNGDIFGAPRSVRGNVSAGEPALRDEKISNSTSDQRVVIYHKGAIKWK